MTPTFLLTDLVDPGLRFLAATVGPRPADSPEARVMLMAIAGQEGNFKERRQRLGGGRFGAANSFWQQEQHGGVAGTLHHPTAGAWARAVCDALDVPSDDATVWQAIAWNDHLAVAMARLNLYTVRAPLPAIGDQGGAWKQYLDQWGPGKPDETRWPTNYAAAIAAVTGANA